MGYDPSVRASEDSPCLRQRGHCGTLLFDIKVIFRVDRHLSLKSVLYRISLSLRGFAKVINFERKDNSLIQLKSDEQFITESRNVAAALANHFISIFNTSYQTIICSRSVTSDIPPTVPSLLVRVGGDGIPSFIIKDVLISLILRILRQLVKHSHSCGWELLWPQYLKASEKTLLIYRNIY
jgi:hypothetical protein